MNRPTFRSRCAMFFWCISRTPSRICRRNSTASSSLTFSRSARYSNSSPPETLHIANKYYYSTKIQVINVTKSDKCPTLAKLVPFTMFVNQCISSDYLNVFPKFITFFAKYCGIDTYQDTTAFPGSCCKTQ